MHPSQSRPDATAFVFDDEVWTYRRLPREVERVARGLVACRVKTLFNARAAIADTETKIARHSTVTRDIYARRIQEYPGFAILWRAAISWLDVVGYLASLTVLATFCMDTFVSLRIVAIASNLLFGIYGIGEHIYPVFFLHAVLLPINILKLVRLVPANRERGTVLPPPFRCPTSIDVASAHLVANEQRHMRGT
jgi:hypothetical protein